MRTCLAPTSSSGSAMRVATPRPKTMRVGMRKRLTLALARIVTAHGTLHRRRRVGRRATAHLAAAPRAVSAAGGMRCVTPLDVGVDAREEDSDDRGQDRAPQQEEQEAEEPEQAAHLDRDRRAE